MANMNEFVGVLTDRWIMWFQLKYLRSVLQALGYFYASVLKLVDESDTVPGQKHLNTLLDVFNFDYSKHSL